MILPDINVLLFALMPQTADHARYREWLAAQLSTPAAFGLSDQVLSGFIRIATNPKIYRPPMPIEKAVRFANELRERPNCSS